MGSKRTNKRARASDVRRVLRSDGVLAKSKHSGPRTTEDLFGAGSTGTLMRGEYSHRDDIHELIQRRHQQGLGWVDEDGVWQRKGHSWSVPFGVRAALKTRLVYAQVVTKYPWYATWISPKTGRRMRKKFMSLPAAIDFVASKAQYVDPQASVIARHGFYIPTKLMGKFPRRSRSGRLYYWCPRCMQPRTFHRNGEVFFATKKFWSDEKSRFVFKDIKLAVVCCSFCGVTNRDSHFRASNQPVEKRTFKQGARRARRRKGHR